MLSKHFERIALEKISRKGPNVYNMLRSGELTLEVRKRNIFYDFYAEVEVPSRAVKLFYSGIDCIKDRMYISSTLDHPKRFEITMPYRGIISGLTAGLKHSIVNLL